ncbi:hypothetical protein [Lactobacillus sp. PV012]|uniref:hypothetical protein n=1 Tax=Lactobacillus sp. PV012 TaxID=2594494 RepID=UPI00223F57CD|nr:hypothetical protein [Lactobacillus sp. PV012]QNQ82304.1 hypothetical protein FP433_04275 [Lactobacillus sp. PV012]
MNQTVKRGLKILGGIIATLIIIYGICVVIFLVGTNSRAQGEKAVEKIALKKTPITKVEETYHLSGDTESNSLLGTDKKGKKYYFIYLPKSKKSYLYNSKDGISEQKVLKLFNTQYPNYKNPQVELGWYKDTPVWEITYKKDNGNYLYVIYSFKSGEKLSYIDNL